MLNDGYRSRSPTIALHHKRQSRSICLPACFSSMSTHPFDVLESEGENNNCSMARTAVARSLLPDIKCRCMNLISKIGGGARSGPGRVRRRHASADFSYDPTSYALNFEDDAGRADDQLFLGGGFSARLSSSSIPTTPHEKKMSRLDDILENDDQCCVAAAKENDNGKGKSHLANGVVARRRGRSRHSSASMDFSYEPSSYAMNFEDDNDELISLRRFGGQLAPPPLKNNLATAPPPPPAKCSALRPEIAAFS